MSTIEEIQQDLACPSCEYNLRGLKGAIVHCPECGQVCDIAKMIARRWTMSWFDAPGLSTIYQPTALASVGTLIVASSLGIRQVGPEVRLMAMLLLLGGWVVLMRKAWAVFQSTDGITLAVLSHAIFAGYIAGVTSIIGAFVWLVSYGFDGSGISQKLLAIAGYIGLTGGGVLLFSLGRRGERYIGERCIRRYLARTSS